MKGTCGTERSAVVRALIRVALVGRFLMDGHIGKVLMITERLGRPRSARDRVAPVAGVGVGDVAEGREELVTAPQNPIPPRLAACGAAAAGAVTTEYGPGR